MTLLLNSEQAMQDIVEQVRHDFRMSRPNSKTLPANRARPRAQVLTRVEHLCLTTRWEGDLDWLQSVFHPEEEALDHPGDQDANAGQKVRRGAVGKCGTHC